MPGSILSIAGGVERWRSIFDAAQRFARHQ
jgi:hypothetical protein